MSLLASNETIAGSAGGNGTGGWTQASASSNAANPSTSAWDAEPSTSSGLVSHCTSIGGNNNAAVKNNTAASNSTATSGASSLNAASAGSSTGVAAAAEEPVVNLNNPEWSASAASGGNDGSDTATPSTSDQTIVPADRQAPTDSTDGTNDGLGEFERQTLHHLLKDDASLDLFSGGWGTTAINHHKPWKIPSNQANVPAHPTFLPIAPAAKGNPMGGNFEQQMHPQQGTAPAGNWRSANTGMLPAASPMHSSSTSGTDLWESSLQKGGRIGPSTGIMTPPATVEPQWTPQPTASHIGGTWGEDEDNSNMWTGVPGPSKSGWVEPKNNWNKPHSSWGGPDHGTA